MNHDEQSLIRTLFGKLADVERQSPPRDPEAERFIHEQVAAQPGSPYYMAQTIVVQEQALEAANHRIRALEDELSARESRGGGLFGSLFGGGSRSAPPRSGAWGGNPPAPPTRPGWGGQQPASGMGGGGFLAGAAQTAMGVAGGVILGNMLADAFSGGGEAIAATAEEVLPEEIAPPEDAGGFGFGDEEI